MALASGDEAVREAQADRLPKRPCVAGAVGIAIGAVPAGDEKSGVATAERVRPLSGTTIVALAERVDGSDDSASAAGVSRRATGLADVAACSSKVDLMDESDRPRGRSVRWSRSADCAPVDGVFLGSAKVSSTALACRLSGLGIAACRPKGAAV